MFVQSATAPKELMLSKVITQADLYEFAETMGSDGLIHVDAEWAVPRYGSTIAQGMLVFSPASQMAVQIFGKQWFYHGRIRVKFVKPVRPGDLITTQCRLRGVEQDIDGARTVYDVTCRKSDRTVMIVGEISCLTT